MFCSPYLYNTFTHNFIINIPNLIFIQDFMTLSCIILHPSIGSTIQCLQAIWNMDVNCPPTTRTQDNVKAAAKIAGIPISNKPVQLLRFSDSLSNDDSIKLLQLNTEVRDALQVGERYSN